MKTRVKVLGMDSDSKYPIVEGRSGVEPTSMKIFLNVDTFHDTMSQQ